MKTLPDQTDHFELLLDARDKALAEVTSIEVEKLLAECENIRTLIEAANTELEFDTTITRS